MVFNDHTIYWICLDHRHAHPKQFILSMSISVPETGRLCANLFYMGLAALSLIDWLSADQVAGRSRLVKRATKRQDPQMNHFTNAMILIL